MATVTSTINTTTTAGMPSGYARYSSSAGTSALSSADDNIATSAISHTLANKKLVVAIEIVTRFNADSDLKLQVSPDGTNWINAQTITAGIGLTGGATKVFVADSSDIYAPYWRLIINESAASISAGSYTGGSIKTAYALST